MMVFNNYKVESPSECKLDLFNEDNNCGFQIEESNQCFYFINKYARMINEQDVNVNDALQNLIVYILQNYLHIDPSIYLKTGFLSQIISCLKSPNLRYLTFFDDICKVIELLTKNQMICEFLIERCYDINVIDICAELIKDEPNVRISQHYLTIIINLLPTFFKFGHEETELYLDSISYSSSYFNLIKFVTQVICEAKDIFRPKAYLDILYGSIEKVDVNEAILSYVFLCFYYLAKKDMTHNDIILIEEQMLFKYVIEYLDPKDENFLTYINSTKVMEPLFQYFGIVFSYENYNHVYYYEILFEYMDFSFFIHIIEKSTNSLIKKKCLNCIFLEITKEGLNHFVEVRDFLKDPNLFPFFAHILKNGSFQERYLAFLIIMQKIAKSAKSTIASIYQLNIMDDVYDFIYFETGKSVLFYYILLLCLDEQNKGIEVACKIKDLCVVEEVENILMSESISDVSKEYITDKLTKLENLMTSVLKKA